MDGSNKFGEDGDDEVPQEELIGQGKKKRETRSK
jgi:hypothetical protein